MTVDDPSGPVSGLLRTVVLGSGSARSTRLFLSVACLFVAAAAAALARSEGITDIGRSTMTVSAIALVPVAAGWLFAPLRGRFPQAFCVVSDVVLATVLLISFEWSAEALTAAVLFAPVGFVAEFTDTSSLHVLHLVVAAVTVTVLAVQAVVQGADRPYVAAMSLGLAVVLSMPTAFSVLQHRLRSALARQQTDPGTGLLNRIGLETAAAENPRPLLAAMSLSISPDPESPHPQLTGERVRRLRQGLLGRGVMTARVAPSELVVASWVDDDTAASSVAARWVDVVDTDNGSGVESVRWDRGVAVVEHNASSVEPDSIAWTVQRALAAAQMRRQSSSTSSENEHASGPDIDHGAIVALIESGGPDVAFQPIHRSGETHPSGYEALARFGAGSPQAWFESAAQQGVGALLERAAIRTAMREARSLHPEMFLSVNVSVAAMLARPAIIADLLEYQQERQCIVEITEHSKVETTPILTATLATLRAAGVKVALDDVGAGYAGLNMIVATHPDLIKIDAFLVRGVDADPQRASTVSAMIALARALGSQSVCEGVETAAERTFCEQAGCDYVQGYAIGRPAPARLAGD